MNALTLLFANLVAIALGIIFFPLVGGIGLFSDGLGRLYGFFTLLFLLLILKTPIVPYLFSKKAKEMQQVGLMGITIGVLGLWISLALSHVSLPNPTEQASAIGGFPLRAFTYPVPPMGSDHIPREMWPAFFLNYLIWIAVGKMIAFGVRRFLKKLPPAWLCVSLVVLGSLYGLGYLLLKFD